MKKFAVIVAVVMAILVSYNIVFAAEKNVKMKKESAEKIMLKLQKLSAIEKAKPEVKVVGIELLKDKDGRVYIKNTAEVDMELAMLKYTGEIKLKAKNEVFIPKEKVAKKGRLGWIYGMMPKDNNTEKLTRGQFFVTYDMIKYKRISITPYLNRWYYGIGPMYKVGNTKLVLGATFKYGEKVNRENAKLLLGVGYDF